MNKNMAVFLLSFLFICSAAAAHTNYADHPVHQDKNLESLISHDVIEARIQEVSAVINAAYADREIMLIMVMKGSVCLAADLMRHIHVPCTLEFVQASSYGMNGMKAGELTVSGLDNLNLAGKHVLLIDDIFDTGNTLKTIATKMAEKKPASLKTLVLLCKKIERTTSFMPDYVLFELDNLFVVGYGLDYKGHYRGLPGIYVLRQEPAQLNA